MSLSSRAFLLLLTITCGTGFLSNHNHGFPDEYMPVGQLNIRDMEDTNARRPERLQQPQLLQSSFLDTGFLVVDMAFNEYALSLSAENIVVRVQDWYNDSDWVYIYMTQTYNNGDIVNSVGNLVIRITDGKILVNFDRFRSTSGAQLYSEMIYSLEDCLNTSLAYLGVPFTEILYDNITGDLRAIIPLPNRPRGIGTLGPIFHAESWMFDFDTEELFKAYRYDMDFISACDWDHYYQICCSSETNEVIAVIDYVNQLPLYTALEIGVQNPKTGVRSPNLPERTFESPNGWHTGTSDAITTRGNNVIAVDENMYEPNADVTNKFHFTFDTSQEPTEYVDACLTQLFYSVNMIHDIYYHYGFNEASGNFQVDNFGRGGKNNDPVRAQCEVTGDINNAFMSTPPDGTSPLLRMLRFTTRKPSVHSAFETGVIWHEFTHGVSNRLTGGPSNTACLFEDEGAGLGEGWSDFAHIMLQTQATDTRLTSVTIGTYLLNNKSGLRQYKWSSDFAVNPITYSYILYSSYHEAHSKGVIWSSILFEVYWNLIERYGFNIDWFGSDGGNNLMFQLVVDGMKIQPCYPLFVNARDAILNAALLRYEDTELWCVMYDGFAKRGLGYGAQFGIDVFNAPVDVCDCPASPITSYRQICVVDENGSIFLAIVSKTVANDLLASGGFLPGTYYNEVLYDCKCDEFQQETPSQQTNCKDCASLHKTRGCLNKEIEAYVCAWLPICCFTEWTEQCVDRAEMYCESTDPSDLPLPTVEYDCMDCTTVHPEGVSGCSSDITCECVCYFDEWCCSTNWDDWCVSEAILLCGCLASEAVGILEVPPTVVCGDCIVSHGSTGCTEKDVQSCVCMAQPSCCTVQWDVECVALALSCGCTIDRNVAAVEVGLTGGIYETSLLTGCSLYPERYSELLTICHYHMVEGEEEVIVIAISPEEESDFINENNHDYLAAVDDCVCVKALAFAQTTSDPTISTSEPTPMGGTSCPEDTEPACPIETIPGFVVLCEETEEGIFILRTVPSTQLEQALQSGYVLPVEICMDSERLCVCPT